MEAPLHCNTESPYTQLDNVQHFLFLVYFKKKKKTTDFELPLCLGSSVAQRGGKTRAGGGDAARVLQAV